MAKKKERIIYFEGFSWSELKEIRQIAKEWRSKIQAINITHKGAERDQLGEDLLDEAVLQVAKKIKRRNYEAILKVLCLVLEEYNEGFRSGVESVTSTNNHQNTKKDCIGVFCLRVLGILGVVYYGFCFYVYAV